MSELEFAVMDRTDEEAYLAGAAIGGADEDADEALPEGSVMAGGEPHGEAAGEASALPAGVVLREPDGGGEPLPQPEAGPCLEQEDGPCPEPQDEAEHGVPQDQASPLGPCDPEAAGLPYGRDPEEGRPGRPDKPIGEYSAKELGREGELMAWRFLKGHGFEMLDRNWTCPAGEADIVCKEGDTHVLVEVKTRLASGPHAADIMPELAVDHDKRSRYRRMACYYMAKNAGVRHVRLDVIAIRVVAEHRARLRHIPGAFAWDES